MALPEYFEFQDRTKIICGAGFLSQLGDEAKLLGGTKALIVTDKIINKLGFPAIASASLKSAGIETVLIRDDVPQDSGVGIITDIYNSAKIAGADICIGLGGGSVLDTMKMVNLLLSEGGDLMADHQGAYIQERPLRPMIAIPTTAGTGSEVTFAAVVKDHDAKMKVGFVSHHFAPNTAILDPKVTTSMPPSVTAFTGMDAMTHAIESLHSTEASPITDVIAAGAVGMIFKSLLKAINNGDDIDARGEMLIASSLAGIAFSNSLVGIVHGIAHSIGGICGVPHGLANSLVLPWCMEYNMDHCTHKYAMVAHAMGVPDSGDDMADALKGVEKLRALISATGLPTKLGEVNVSESQFEDIANLTMCDGTIYTNPRPVEDPADVIEILKKAF